MATNESKKNVVISLDDMKPLEAGAKRVIKAENTSRLYPDLDADGEYVHFEMTPMSGDSLLWLTLRRGITPQRAALSLRKIADLIDRQGVGLLQVLEGSDEPVRLTYNDAGDMIVADR